MGTTIDMQFMRYINLFSKVCRVSTTKCFMYNNQIVFAVPKGQVSFAIGKDAVNVKRLRDTLRKKIKVIAMPAKDDDEGIITFIKDLVSPVEFTGVEIKDSGVTVTAGRQNKAALIGRNRVREKELLDILKNHFGFSKVKIA
ncbi:KH domain-containing protein [archaeon]|jgi:NusA-like KH domain protein|nr:KH domain-containing protein [archaeon]MBT6183072.1 KH domain-containing protein [archaeon]MBT6606236.1 KH domain-containing protein [archaeon]MBT7251595.1 KH domain-containing protein [archaeon]MBT7660898.1 KH domain-containing protein [archaeon]